MIILSVEKAKRPRLIPGKGFSLPEISGLQNKLTPYLKNMPPIALRGESTKSRPGYGSFMIQTPNASAEPLSEGEISSFYWRLLLTAGQVVGLAITHAHNIQDGAIPLLAFYKYTPFGISEKPRTGHTYYSRCDFELLELGGVSEQDATFPAFALGSQRAALVGKILLTDQYFMNPRQTENRRSAEKTLLGAYQVWIVAYHETLNMFLKLAQSNWEG